MKKLLVISLVFVLIFLIFIIKIIPNKSSDIDGVISKGYLFLDKRYSNGAYDDEYLKYVYPGENLYCPLEGCKITYRIIDAYFGILFIREFGDYGGLFNQADYASKVLSSLLELWRKEKIYNTKKSIQQDRRGVALDTYCILGYIYSDKEMAINTLSYLEGDKWLEEGFYRDDVWRNVADESWCIRLLIKTGEGEDGEIRKLIFKKIGETDKIILLDVEISSKVATVIHTIYMLHDFYSIKSDDTFNKKLRDYQDYVFFASQDKIIKGDDLTLSNILDSLAYSKYEKIKLQEMTNILISRQKTDGGWYTGEGISRDNLSVFTTMRVITSLLRFKELQES